jgi:hypothetical protein
MNNIIDMYIKVLIGLVKKPTVPKRFVFSLAQY